MNDVLYAMWLINTTNIGQYGMLALCVTATMVVSRRFSRALTAVEELSSDLAETNVALRKIDQIKDQFLANTSHELRTPLHGMIGLSESMIDGAAGILPPKAVENLLLISSSGHRLASMVNDLLDMAKIQDKGLSLNLRPVDLYSLSEMVIRLSLPLAGGKPLEIVNRIDPAIPAVYADEDRIRQVLYNLVGNAIKFTNNGTVEISASELHRRESQEVDSEGRWLEVRVSDTGIGVPDEYKDKIFEAYRQVDEGIRARIPAQAWGSR
jgi:two-component system sensor histidine kinase ChiS